jgi:DNA-binding beta-propeller fold protein YncE
MSSEASTVVDLSIIEQGSKLLSLDQSNENIHGYSMSTAYDLSTASYTGNSLSLSTESAVPIGFIISNDGSKLIMLDYDQNNLFEYTMSTSFDITTASNTNSYSFGTTIESPGAIGVNDDGTELYIIDDSDILHEVALGTPFDIASLSITGTTTSIGTDVVGREFKWNI